MQVEEVDEDEEDDEDEEEDEEDVDAEARFAEQVRKMVGNVDQQI